MVKTKRHRKYHLWRKYGITEDQYEELLQDQGGCCGVCGRNASVFRNFLCVDHDHKTGRIRGVLCVHCNRYIIGRHRDPLIFDAAARYLRRTVDLYIPKKKKRKLKRGRLRV